MKNKDNLSSHPINNINIIYYIYYTSHKLYLQNLVTKAIYQFCKKNKVLLK